MYGVHGAVGQVGISRALPGPGLGTSSPIDARNHRSHGVFGAGFEAASTGHLPYCPALMPYRPWHG